MVACAFRRPLAGYLLAILSTRRISRHYPLHVDAWWWSRHSSLAAIRIRTKSWDQVVHIVMVVVGETPSVSVFQTEFVESSQCAHGAGRRSILIRNRALSLACVEIFSSFRRESSSRRGD